MMNIQAEKIEIMKLVLATEDEEILKNIKDIFKNSHPSDFWQVLPNEQKEDILAGIDEVTNGKIVDYDAFISNHLK